MTLNITSQPSSFSRTWFTGSHSCLLVSQYSRLVRVRWFSRRQGIVSVFTITHRSGSFWWSCHQEPRPTQAKTGWPLAMFKSCTVDELCLHYGTLWCTLQLTKCSICSLWRPVKNVHNAECTFTNPKTPDIWSLAELDYHRARASSPSALNFPSQQEPSHYLLHHNFSTYITSTTATTTSTHTSS